jgi:S1-C subfamily serine protease
MKRLLCSIVIAVVFFGGCDKRPVVGIADQVEQARGSVVHIEKVGECQGSGAIISNDGIIFTAKHVTDGGGEFIVTLDNGEKYETNICVESKDFDVAFLKINTGKSLPFVGLADLISIRVGDPVFIMGSPFGRDNFNSVSLGIISCLQRNLDVPEDYGYGWKVTFQTDATAEPGNSGGPVFNLDGQVIGVLVAGMDATVNYSVPVAVFRNDLNVVKVWFELYDFEIPEPPIYIPPDRGWKIEQLRNQIQELQKSIDYLMDIVSRIDPSAN